MSIENGRFIPEEALKKQEKMTHNLENEKLANNFTEAVKNFVVEELDVDFDEEATKSFADSLQRSKLFLLGETHGVEENPNIIYTFIKKFGFKKLALEWDKNLEKTVNDYLEAGKLDFDSIQENARGDGRITAGHFAMIKKLHEEGLIDKLIFVDNDQFKNSAEREKGMAKSVLDNISDTPMLVVVGNSHAKTELGEFRDEAKEPDRMGKIIKKNYPNVFSGIANYRSGEHHNYDIGSWGNNDNPELPKKAQFYRSHVTEYQFTAGEYVFELPRAHAAKVPNPDLKFKDIKNKK